MISFFEGLEISPLWWIKALWYDSVSRRLTSSAHYFSILAINYHFHTCYATSSPVDRATSGKLACKEKGALKFGIPPIHQYRSAILGRWSEELKSLSHAGFWGSEFGPLFNSQIPRLVGLAVRPPVEWRYQRSWKAENKLYEDWCPGSNEWFSGSGLSKRIASSALMEQAIYSAQTLQAKHIDLSQGPKNKLR